MYLATRISYIVTASLATYKTMADMQISQFVQKQNIYSKIHILIQVATYLLSNSYSRMLIIISHNGLGCRLYGVMYSNKGMKGYTYNYVVCCVLQQLPIMITSIYYTLCLVRPKLYYYQITWAISTECFADQGKHSTMFINIYLLYIHSLSTSISRST